MATISFHVSYGEKKKIVKVENQDELKGRIVKTFGLPDDTQLKLQLYCKEWDDWVDTDFEDEELAQGGKLKVVWENADVVQAAEKPVTPVLERAGNCEDAPVVVPADEVTSATK